MKTVIGIVAMLLSRKQVWILLALVAKALKNDGKIDSKEAAMIKQRAMVLLGEMLTTNA